MSFDDDLEEVEPRPRRLSLLFALFLVAAGVFVAVSGWNDWWDEKPGGTTSGIRIGLVPAPSSLSPLLDRGGEAREVQGALFRGLLDWDRQGAQQPRWASRIPSGGGGTFRSLGGGLAEYYFQLREDARWSDDKPLAASDFLFAYRMAVHPSFSRAHVDWTSCIKQMDLPGPRDLRITVYRSSRRDALSFLPLPAHLLETGTLDPVAFAHLPYHERPVGNGPYRIKSRSTRVIRLEANPGYRPASARVDELRFITYATLEQALTGLAKGEIDVMRLPPERAADHTPPEVEVKITAGTTLRAVVFNARHPVTSQVPVRRALARATNRPALLKACGTVVPTESWLPPGHGAYRPSFEGVRFDLAQARKDLAEGPWRIDAEGHFVDGRSTEVLSITYDAERSDTQPVVLALRESWRAMGLSVGLVPLDHESYEERLRRGDFCVALQDMDVTPWTDPSAYFAKDSIPDKRNGLRGSNLSGFTHPAQEKLLREIGRAEALLAARPALEKQQDNLALLAPILPLCFNARAVAVRRGLEGLCDRGYGEITWNVEAWHWK